MHLYFKSVCNKEHKGVVSNMTPSSNSSQKDECFGKNYSSLLDFTRNYERTSGLFVPWVPLPVTDNICSCAFKITCIIIHFVYSISCFFRKTARLPEERIELIQKLAKESDIYERLARAIGENFFSLSV